MRGPSKGSSSDGPPPKSSKQRYRAFRHPKRRDDARHHGRTSNVREPAPRAARRNYLRAYIHWLRPYTWSIVAVFALALTAAAMSLVLPWATMYIIDEVLPNKDRATLTMLGAGLLVLIVVQQLIDFVRHWRLAKLGARVVFRMRQRLFGHLLKLPLHKLSEMKTGGITSRLSGDLDNATGLLNVGLVMPGVAAAKVLLTIGVLFWINWQMSVAAIILLPPIVALNLLTIRRVRPIYRSMRGDRAEIDGRVVETFGGIRDVRAFGREKTEARRYAVAHHTVIRKQLLANWFEQLVRSGWGLFVPLCGLFVIWFGGTLHLANAESTTIGGIVAFQMYLMMLLMPVSMIVQSYGQTQQALAAMERVFDLLEIPADKPDRPDAVAVPLRVGAPRAGAASRNGIESFEFDDVGFSYSPGQPVLTSFSLRVAGGTSVALVGPSGAGKTTVTNLVARFHDPTHGAIRLNGVDLRDIKLAGYRGLLGLVQQETFLFDGTIGENIAYGRIGATAAEIEHAARRANAHEFIQGFPDAYDTLVGERGVRLSGGQAQRISIARAILADPQILILDEATSNLDSESEQLIQASMRELLADRTTFVIAHRLSTVMNADLIVVLEDGRITESGTHAKLMESDGRYRAMVERQQRGLTEPAAADWLA
ncbi:MAG: ABC transporter ATP-binding protein [Planctomycetes bacterium]|nr:ABC transporter ATP-binding protein [Planctomycetota bacterium]